MLIPGAEVFLEDHVLRMGSRKLRYSLIGVKKGEKMVNMDSQAPNKVCEEALEERKLHPPCMGELALIRREKTFGSSRFDFYLEGKDGEKGFMEVKGVTLEDGGIARFPYNGKSDKIQYAMKYENICRGNFIDRPNRFIAEVIVDGQKVRAHVKNTGRCRELLIPGAEVFLEDHVLRMGSRKLRYSLIGVKKGEKMVNMDSQAPNKVCEEALEERKLHPPCMGELALIRREKTFGSSRFDFYLEGKDGEKGFMEVKGVTLEDGGIARFPDAPTERGVKHIFELIRAVKEGYRGFILFVIQMEGIECFTPNDDTHRAFGDALRAAEKEGVKIIAHECRVTEDKIELSRQIPVKL